MTVIEMERIEGFCNKLQECGIGMMKREGKNGSGTFLV